MTSRRPYGVAMSRRRDGAANDGEMGLSRSINQAFVTYQDLRPSCLELVVTGVSTSCVGCSLQPILGPVVDCTALALVDSNFEFRFTVNGVPGSFLFGEGGWYNATVDTNGALTVANVAPSIQRDLPVLYAILILIALNLVVRGAWRFWNSRSNSSSAEAAPMMAAMAEVAPQQTEPAATSAVNSVEHHNRPQESTAKPKAKKRARIASIDSMRGLCLSIMIFVNYGGGYYWYLNHSIWNGLTVADLVFPWFIFLMGTSAAIGHRSATVKKTAVPHVLLHAAIRSVALFCYGLLIACGNRENGTQFSTLRIPGVLQRFAISYLVVTVVIYCIPGCDSPPAASVAQDQEVDEERRGSSASTVLRKLAFAARDVIDYRWQWLVMLVLVLVWIVATFAVPIGGCPLGYIGPGGLASGGAFYNCTGGTAGRLDMWLLGFDHVYHHGTYVETYATTYPLDPEGILGSLNSIVLCFLGVAAGRVLLRDGAEPRLAAARLVGNGCALCLVAAALCGFTQDGGPIPVNKNLWSTSFVLLLGGFAHVLLCAFFAAVDVLSVWDGKPFLYLGMNSILVYMGSELIPSRVTLAVPQNSHPWVLFSNILTVGVWTLFSFWLYCHDWFFAV